MPASRTPQAIDDLAAPTSAPAAPAATQTPTAQVPTPTRFVTETPTAAALTPTLPPTATSTPPTPTARPPSNLCAAYLCTYEVVDMFPHDPEAFTQGLQLHEGVLYEGTGLLGRSTIRAVDLTSGEVLRERPLADHFFGEGLAVVDDRLYQLTWFGQVGFVYDRDTFEPLREFSYQTEGWGLTFDGRRLIMSDGTNVLHFLDEEGLRETGRVEVYEGSTPIPMLNELEYVQGEVLANVWRSDYIVRIAPDSGQVVGWIQLSGLLDESYQEPVDVLNGIAYDAASNHLLVTGKLWPWLFELEIVPVA